MCNDRVARTVGLIQINHLFILTVRSLIVSQPPAVLDLVKWSSIELNIHCH